MVWVGDDSAADSDYDILEESPSSDTSTLSHQQAVWNPSKLKFCILPNEKYVLTLKCPVVSKETVVFL